jgi:hypothetical protein
MTDPTVRPHDVDQQAPAAPDDAVVVQRAPRVTTTAEQRSSSVEPPRETVARGAGETVGRRERVDAADRLGGVRWGAVFFGWLCAMGVAVILVAVVAATGTAIGLTESTVTDVVDGAVTNAGAVSIGGAIAVVVVLAISYLAGGYVAARMARFSGRSQGAAVWAFGLVMTVVGALVGVVLGSAYDVLARLDLPRIPIDEGTATSGGIITLVAVLVVTLLAALIGGALGDRYHRRLDAIDLR